MRRLFASVIAVISIAASLYACSNNSRRDLIYREGDDATPFR